MGLFIAAILAGAGGSFTPCTLGVNLVMVNQLTKEPRAQRVKSWIQFAVSRAALLAAIGLVIGLLGQLIETFTWWFQMVVNSLIIVMGVLFILSRKKPLLPGLDLAGRRTLRTAMSPVAMGALFGLNITACVAPLVLALLARTVLIGNWISGGLALFVFGIMLSLPILIAVLNDKASSWIRTASGKHRPVYYAVIGGVLIVLGAVEIGLSMYVIPGRI